MKNFLRILMFLTIGVAIVSTTIFLTKQNSNYVDDSSTILSNDEVDEKNNYDSGDMSGEINVENISGELVDSGEANENIASGELSDVSGDNVEVIEEQFSGEKIDEEISGEVSGEISGEYVTEEQAA